MRPQIFISYRRDIGRPIARNIYDRLSFKGYNVFFDYTSMRNGKFNEQIYKAIECIDDFILVLSKGSMDRCVNPDDWVRCEIEHAIKHNKNIILVQDEEFLEFPSNFPKELSTIKLIDFTPLSEKYYEAFMVMLESRLSCQKVKSDEYNPSSTNTKSNAKEVFTNLAISLSNMYNIAQQINIPYIEKGCEIESMSLPLDEESRALTLNLIECLESVKDVLSDIQSSNYLLKSYTSKLASIKSQCKRISLESGISLNMESISDVSAILDYAISHLKRMTLGTYIQARLATNMADTKIIDMPYNNSPVRTLFFLGGIIMTNTKNKNGLEVINWGAAIIHDLYYSIPNSEDINQMGLDIICDDFYVKDYVSYSLLNAIESVESIGDLYYLKAKQ